MANLKDYEKLTTRERQNRYFSEDFKRRKVSEIERNLTGVADISKEYEVTRAAVYKWIYQYSRMRKKGVKQVVEAKSDTKRIAALKAQVQELQRIIGEKQVKIDFQDKMIEIAESEFDIEIKKKLSGKHSSGTGSTGKSTK